EVKRLADKVQGEKIGEENAKHQAVVESMGALSSELALLKEQRAKLLTRMQEV
ncbi:hypothetical protein LTR28_000852, partial [Elasticomyces elasticus]